MPRARINQEPQANDPPTFKTTHHTSSQFVESAGAILFDFPSLGKKRVCLVNHLVKDEWLLAKGRRNIGESRAEAAFREVREETGHECRPHAATMSTRAPRGDEPHDVPDQVRVYSGCLTEPFMYTRRDLEGKSEKLIWWYIAEAVVRDIVE